MTTDDLRTRIAAAIERDAYRQSEWWDELPHMDELADAVIAELGLRTETEYAWDRDSRRDRPIGVRYVTEWEAE